MRMMTRYDLERIAEQVLREYRKLPAAQERPYRVDPELLAKELLGLTVRYRKLSGDGELLGLTSFGELVLSLPDSGELGPALLDGKTVLLEEDLLHLPSGPGRRNFTLAHECAHHILYRADPAAYADAVAACRAPACRRHRLCARSGRRDWEEWRMDVLASALLMPRDQLRKNLALAGCPEGIPILNQVWRREDYGRFMGLCRMMGVSKQALACRLRLLGLLGRDDTACPNAMIDILMDEEEAI